MQNIVNQAKSIKNLILKINLDQDLNGIINEEKVKILEDEKNNLFKIIRKAAKKNHGFLEEIEEKLKENNDYELNDIILEAYEKALCFNDNMTSRIFAICFSHGGSKIEFDKIDFIKSDAGKKMLETAIIKSLKNLEIEIDSESLNLNFPIIHNWRGDGLNTGYWISLHDNEMFKEKTMEVKGAHGGKVSIILFSLKGSKEVLELLSFQKDEKVFFSEEIRGLLNCEDMGCKGLVEPYLIDIESTDLLWNWEIEKFTKKEEGKLIEINCSLFYDFERLEIIELMLQSETNACLLRRYGNGMSSGDVLKDLFDIPDLKRENISVLVVNKKVDQIQRE